MSDQTTPKSKRRWRRRLITLGVLAAISVGGWLYVKSVVEARVVAELSGLGIGKPKIGSVSLGFDGVDAKSIEFYRLPTDNEPWITLGSLSIRHPFSGLLAGVDVFNELELDRLEVLLNVDEKSRSPTVELNSLKLPAKTLKLLNSTVVIRQQDRIDLSVQNISATLVATDEFISLHGNIGDLVAASWSLAGELRPSSNSYEIRLQTELAKLVDGQWQNWPGMPSSIGRYVRGDAQASVRGTLTGDANAPFVLIADINVDDARLMLPSIQLPIHVTGGTARIADGKITYENLVATIDGKDKLMGSGSTSIDGFPLKTKFQADLANLDITTLRKLAAQIPIQLTGRFNGPATGQVDVEKTLRTSVALTTTLESSSSAYGSIKANSSKTQVKLQPLILDANQALEKIDGSINVVAKAENQPVNDVFATLNLEPLAQQMEIEATASGEVRLDLPLATAGKIETWKMKVSASAPQGKISQQPIQDIRLEANLARGNLTFNDITAIPVVDPELKPAVTALPKLQLKIDWPIAGTAAHPEVGHIDIFGEQVPTQWLTTFIERQIQNSRDNENLEDQAEFETKLNRLRGLVNFNLKLLMDAVAPDAIEKWSAKGVISNSLLVVNKHQLKNLNSRLELDAGKLSFIELTGMFKNGGDLSAQGKLDLLKGRLESAEATTKDMPLEWIATIAAEADSDIASLLGSAGIQTKGGDSELEGKLSAKIELIELVPQNAKPWQVRTRITSDQLRIKGQQLNNLAVEGEFDERRIRIQNAHAELPNRGLFDLTGTWQIDQRSGNADLKWSRLPLNWLSGFGWSASESVRGTTSGNVRMVKKARLPGDPAIPIGVEGSVNTRELGFAGLKTRELSFEIHSNDDKVLFDQFRSDGDLRGVQVAGELDLNAPFAFRGDGSIKTLSLSRVFLNPSITERLGETLDVTGIANAKFSLDGQLSSFDWNSAGELSVTNARVNGADLSDVSAEWHYFGNEWRKSKAFVRAFGGEIKLVELGDTPERIKVELNEIDTQELASIYEQPVSLTGKLSGDASFNDWSLAETRWMDLNLRGAALRIGKVDFGNLVGSAEYRKQKLKYSLAGNLLNGNFASEGETELDPTEDFLQKLPLTIQYTRGSLNQLYRNLGQLTAIRPLTGALSANVDAVFHLDRFPTANGTVKVNNVRWKNELLTREVSTDLKLNLGVLELNNVRADLQRGEVSGRVSVPLSSSQSGSYVLNIRHFDMERLLQIMMNDPLQGVGLLDARISGQVGPAITGQGSISVSRASLFAQTGSAFELPIQFRFQPAKKSGRIELRRTRFQLFNGTVSGKATIDVGPSLNLRTDLQISKLDTASMFESLAGLENSGQGDLSGHLILKGSSIRSLRDLKGSFTGSLERSSAFQLPLLDQVARLMGGGNQLQSRDFESDDIDLQLNRGRIEIRRLNFSNSLAQIAVSGDAFVDGRLDLNVAGRIERINQPTMIEQFAGSPLSRFSGSPVALLSQAADFLSERLVFVKITGTVRRPQIRPDAGKQLQEETIRYFLGGRQLSADAGLPNR